MRAEKNVEMALLPQRNNTATAVGQDMGNTKFDYPVLCLSSLDVSFSDCGLGRQVRKLPGCLQYVLPVKPSTFYQSSKIQVAFDVRVEGKTCQRRLGSWFWQFVVSS